MNIDDTATLREEEDRERSMNVRKPVTMPTGSCHWCESVCEGVFCSGECKEYFEQHARFVR